MTRLSTQQLSELKDDYIAMRENISEGLKRRSGKSLRAGNIIFSDRRQNYHKPTSRKEANGGLWVWAGMVLNIALNSGLYNEIEKRLYTEDEIRKMFTRDVISEFYFIDKRPEEAFWDVLRRLKTGSYGKQQM